MAGGGAGQRERAEKAPLRTEDGLQEPLRGACGAGGVCGAGTGFLKVHFKICYGKFQQSGLQKSLWGPLLFVAFM